MSSFEMIQEAHSASRQQVSVTSLDRSGIHSEEQGPALYFNGDHPQATGSFKNIRGATCRRSTINQTI